MRGLGFFTLLVVCAAPAVALAQAPAAAQAQRCPAPPRPVTAEQMTGYVGFLRQAADMLKANDDEGFADGAEQVQWRDGWLGYVCSDAKAITAWREQNDMTLEASPGCMDIYELACAMDRDSMVDDFRDAAVVVEACAADLDRAVEARTKECSATVEPVQELPSTQVFQEELADYGTWVETEKQGQVWYPSADQVGADFQPFKRGGKWSYTDRGWTWVSDWPWGWGPFHYGRWNYDGERRAWYWIPGRTWMPATVSFRYNDDAVGWAPLAPDGVGDWPLDYWTFVPPAHIYSPTWSAYVVPGPRVAVFFGRTRLVPIAYRHRAIYGPPIRVVARAGVVIRPVPLRNVIRVTPPVRVAVRATVLPSGRRLGVAVAPRPGGVMRPAVVRPLARPGTVVRPPARPSGPGMRPPAVRPPAAPPPGARVPRPRPAGQPGRPGTPPGARPGTPPGARPGTPPGPRPGPGARPGTPPGPRPGPGVRPGGPPPQPWSGTKAQPGARPQPPRPGAQPGARPQPPRPGAQPGARPQPPRPGAQPGARPQPRPGARPAPPPPKPRPAARPAPAPKPAARPAPPAPKPRPAPPAPRKKK